MFGYFYNSSIRNYAVILGELFGHVQIKRVRENQDKYIKVPISYASKELFIQKLTNAFNNAENKDLAKVETILPRMSLQLVDVMYDETFKTGILNHRSKSAPDGKLNGQFNPVPYKFTYQLGVYTRYEDDMYQIVEQILPYFQPTFNCKVKELYKNEIVIDRVVPVTVTSVMLDEQLEGGRSERRRLEWTLTIEVQGWIYPAAAVLKGEIKTVYLDFHANEHTIGNDDQFESIDFQVDPDDIKREDWNGEYVEGSSNNTPIPVDPDPSKPRGDLRHGQIS